MGPLGCGRGPRCKLQVALENRGTGAWINLLETHRFAATTVAENRLAPSCADVGHPVHVLPEHRHEIALPLVIGDHHRERSAPATKPTADLERVQSLRSEPGCSHPPPDAVQEPRHTVRPATSIHPPVELVRHRAIGTLPRRSSCREALLGEQARCRICVGASVPTIEPLTIAGDERVARAGPALAPALCRKRVREQLRSVRHVQRPRAGVSGD